MKKIGLSIFAIVSVVGVLHYVRPLWVKTSNVDNSIDLMALSKRSRPPLPPKPTPAASGTVFTDTFDSAFSLEETGTVGDSKSTNWWLNSGAYFYAENGTGRTVTGELSGLNPWRVAYNNSNPVDTDSGYHPQNIFRLLSKPQWQNQDTQVYFQIKKHNLSTSPNRNQSNGLLLMSRYLDGNNLYYVGVRVDGTSIIKKKISGTYYTLSQKPIPGIVGVYNTSTNPNLLPVGIWIGVRSIVTNQINNSVNIKQYVDIGKTGIWTLVSDVSDSGSQYGPAPLSSAGSVGLRTDFMDVLFEDFRVLSL